MEMYEGDDLTFAASIGYYALLSLFPILLIVISILGSVAATDANRLAVMRFVLTHFPRQVDFIITQLDAFRQTPIRLGVGGGLALVWASLGGFNAVGAAVARGWGGEKQRSFWRRRLFWCLLLGVAGLLLRAALLLATAVRVVEARWFATYHWSSPQLSFLRAMSVRYAALLIPA